jgi:hypothetical protein
MAFDLSTLEATFVPKGVRLMPFSISTLAPVAEALAKAGAPILSKIVGTVLPFPANLLASTVINSLSAAFGASADDPDALASAIASDPNAVAKVNAVAQAHADDIANALDFARLQADTNAKESENPGLFIAGWRPALGWSLGMMVTWQWGATIFHGPLVEVSVYNVSLGVLATLIGARTFEKWKGVATPAIGKVVSRLRGK